MHLAWHIEALHRAKKIPKLEKLLMTQDKRRIQTVEEQIAIMDRWVAVTNRIEPKAGK